MLIPQLAAHVIIGAATSTDGNISGFILPSKISLSTRKFVYMAYSASSVDFHNAQ